VTKSSTLRAACVAALLGVGVTACGSSSTATPTSTGSGAAGTAGGAIGTTAAAVKSSGGGGGSFCRLEADSMKKAQQGAAAPGGTSPATLREKYRTLRHDEQPAIDSAPVELRSDLNLLLDASVKYGAELAKVNFDVAQQSPALSAATAAFSTPAVQAASTHVLTYLKDQCHIDFTAGGTAP
jgi:hypothetical protein